MTELEAKVHCLSLAVDMARAERGETPTESVANFYTCFYNLINPAHGPTAKGKAKATDKLPSIMD